LFVEDIKRQMRSFAIGRRVRKKEEGFELREPQSSYKALFDTEKVEIEWKNLWLWNVILARPSPLWRPVGCKFEVLPKKIFAEFEDFSG